MERHCKEILVFRVKKVTRGQDAWFYVRSAGSSYSSNLCADPLEAKDFTQEPTTVIVKTIEALAKGNETQDCFELVKMKITTDVEPVDMNAGEIIEERRRQALAKLNPWEIEALSLEKLASYNKLKFHGEK